MPASNDSLIEEQLDLTMRQLKQVSDYLTPREIKSICKQLSYMYHTMAHKLVVKALDSDGVAHTDHLGLVGCEQSIMMDAPDGYTANRFGQHHAQMALRSPAPREHDNHSGYQGPASQEPPSIVGIDAHDRSDMSSRGGSVRDQMCHPSANDASQ